MHSYLRQLRSQEADFGCEVQLTCLSLPLVKHGDIEVRILFHVSSLAEKTEVSRGPENISCEHQRIEDTCKIKQEIGDFKVLIMRKLRFKCYLFFSRPKIFFFYLCENMNRGKITSVCNKTAWSCHFTDNDIIDCKCI